MTISTTCCMQQAEIKKDLETIHNALIDGFGAQEEKRPQAYILKHYEIAQAIILHWPQEERARLLNTTIKDGTILNLAICWTAPLDFIKFLINQGCNANLLDDRNNETTTMSILTSLQDQDIDENDKNYLTKVFQYLTSLPETNINVCFTPTPFDYSAEHSLLKTVIETGNHYLLTSLLARNDLIMSPFNFPQDPEAGCIIRLINHTNFIKEISPLLLLDETNSLSNPLHSIAEIGNPELIKKTYQMNPSWAYAFDEDGNTPLHAAVKLATYKENLVVKKRYLQTIEALLSCNPYLAHLPNQHDVTAQQMAQKLGMGDEFEAILATLNPQGTMAERNPNAKIMLMQQIRAAQARVIAQRKTFQ